MARTIASFESECMSACAKCAGQVNILGGRYGCAQNPVIDCVLPRMVQQIKDSPVTARQAILDALPPGWAANHIKDTGAAPVPAAAAIEEAEAVTIEEAEAAGKKK